MGYSRVRNGRDGKPRYTAYYWDIRGRERSAGTFSSRKEADKAWQREETKVAEGRAGDPRRGRQTFERYVRVEWLPTHVMELRTRENYTYYLDRRIIPEFGPMRMVEILPAHVREWVTKLTREGVKPQAVRYCMVVLSAIFTTALNDQVTFLHPCKGVKTPPIPKRPHNIISPEQFDDLYTALPSETMKLLVETDIESGLRWGELAELRPRDLDFGTGVLTVSRVVVELTPRFHPDGGRFLIKDYPKDQEHRRLKLSRQIVAKIKAFIEAQGLGDDDLLFAMPQLPQQPTLRVMADSATLGLTEPNDVGRRYRHGTLSAYSAGKCRCEQCRGAYATYRAQRRAAGQDQPRARRTVVTDGHIPRWWFRTHVWLPAIEASGLPESITVHGLRHAHASWLLAGGADLQVVKERLGHSSIVTTQKYLGTLDEGDETAIDRRAQQDPQPQQEAQQPEPEEVGMNPRTRRVALYAIGAIAILASVNALAHSYAGLYEWAIHHRLTGWQAKSWPAEIDVFLAVGELALYVAYLDDWPARWRIWPWATALIGLAVSVAGNIGHIQAEPGQPVIVADRLTAATSPVAAFAGLSVGLLVLKMTRQRASSRPQGSDANATLMLAARAPGTSASSARSVPAVMWSTAPDDPLGHGECDGAAANPGLLRDAIAICQHAAARGERFSQRALARQLRLRGHRFPNDHLHRIAQSVWLATGRAA